MDKNCEFCKDKATFGVHGVERCCDEHKDQLLDATDAFFRSLGPPDYSHAFLDQRELNIRAITLGFTIPFCFMDSTAADSRRRGMFRWVKEWRQRQRRMHLLMAEQLPGGPRWTPVLRHDRSRLAVAQRMDSVGSR